MTRRSSLYPHHNGLHEHFHYGSLIRQAGRLWSVFFTWVALWFILQMYLLAQNRVMPTSTEDASDATLAANGAVSGLHASVAAILLKNESLLIIDGDVA